MNRLIDKLPNEVAEEAKEMAPEHGRSNYGEPIAGLLPSDIYEERHAKDALEKGRKAEKIAGKVLKSFERQNLKVETYNIPICMRVILWYVKMYKNIEFSFSNSTSRYQ